VPCSRSEDRRAEQGGSMSSSRPNKSDTIRYLIEILKDENENSRRAAVEVSQTKWECEMVKYCWKR